jgi:hypothetical protein
MMERDTVMRAGKEVYAIVVAGNELICLFLPPPRPLQQWESAPARAAEVTTKDMTRLAPRP